MHTNRRATAAVIFSRVSAPPPPLIMWRCSVTSSAPSTYTGSSFTLFRSSTRTPIFLSLSALASEAATAPSIWCLIAASASMNLNTVDPEPTPTIGSWTYFSASRATRSLSSSWVIRTLLFTLRRKVGADPLEHFCGHADRLGRGRVGMDGLADVGCVRAHLHGEGDLANQVARAQADDATAHNAVRLGVEDELGEALVAGVGNGAARCRP